MTTTEIHPYVDNALQTYNNILEHVTKDESVAAILTVAAGCEEIVDQLEDIKEVLAGIEHASS